MMCEHHTSDFFSALFATVVFYIIFDWVVSYMGLRFLSSVLFYFIPTLALWVSYGMSPTCFPMVPPCLGDDIIARLQTVFPLSISLPPALYKSHNTSAGLVSCTTLGFTSWEDPVIYAAVGLGVQSELPPDYLWVVDVTALTGKNWTSNFLEKQGMIRSPDRDAYTTCALVTSVSVLPALLVAVGVVVLALSLVTYVFSLIPFVLVLGWEVMIPEYLSDIDSM